MWEWLKKLPGRVWLWVASILGGLVLMIGVYLAGSSRRRGELETKLAERELDKANKAYDEASKKTAALHEKQKKLVADILADHLARAEQMKRTKGLTDEQVLDELRARGDVVPDGDKQR